MSNDNRDGVYALAIVGHLSNLVEAVRALNPATVATARCSCTHEAGDSDCAMHPSCNVCGADLGDHQALKPAPVAIPTWLQHFEPIGSGRVDHVEEMHPELGEQQGEILRLQKLVRDQLAELDRGYAEIERLQKVVADQALTVSTLKDENGRLEARRKHVEDAIEKLLLEKDEAIGRASAELRRFREREKDVRELVSLLGDPELDLNCALLDALAAVRDLKVTP